MLGYRTPDQHPLPISGHFDTTTKRAVEQFQREHGLHVDGVVGKDTRAVFARIEANPFVNKWHPHHGLYEQALSGIHAEETRRHITHGEHSQRLAGSLVADALRHGMNRIDRVQFNKDGTLLCALQVSHERSVLDKRTDAITTDLAVRQPLLDSHVQTQVLSAHQFAPRHDAPIHAMSPPVHAAHAVSR